MTVMIWPSHDVRRYISAGSKCLLVYVMEALEYL